LNACAKDKDAAKLVIAELAETNEAEQVNKKEKRKAQAAKKKPAAKKKAKGSDSEEDFDFGQTPPRKQKGRKKAVNSQSDEDDDSFIQTAARNKRQPRKLASRNEAIEEGDEDEEMESPTKQRRGRKKAVVDSDDELFSGISIEWF